MSDKTNLTDSIFRLENPASFSRQVQIDRLCSNFISSILIVPFCYGWYYMFLGVIFRLAGQKLGGGGGGGVYIS